MLNPTSFNAIYSGIVNGSPVSFTVPVTVVSSPTANFTITQPSNDCAVKTVTLSSTTQGSSPVVSWNWVYGDGVSAVLTNNTAHTHSYISPGSYSVTLLVIDANGCDDQITVGPVSVINSPTAVISSNPQLLVGCQSTFSASFSAGGSLGNNLSYSWNFGNGQSSTLANPAAVTFTSQTAVYTVSLTVTSQGCSNTAVTYVTVSPATLSVAATPTVCLNTPYTATINTNQPFSLWNINGVLNPINTPQSPVPSPTVLVPGFSAAGIHTVVVSAGQAPCIANPVTYTVFVETVSVNIAGSSPTIGCSSPFPVSYSAIGSPNVVSYLWTITGANNAVSNYTSANVNYLITGGSLNSWSMIKQPYIPQVNLVVSSVNGCTAAVTKTVHVLERPTAWFNMSATQGCSPLVVTLSDSSYMFPSCPITSYTWNNGANPPTLVTGTLALPPASNSVIPSQTFTYTSLGTYSPFLVIETASGYTNTAVTCIDASFQGTVIVVDQPTISFSLPSGTFCPNQPIQITNTSPSIGNVQHWDVDSDNGYFSSCISDANPSWMFTHTGTFNFTLTGYDHSCKSSAVMGPVTIDGPIGRLRYETNCTGNRYQVNFESELEAASSATLYYGDGASVTYTGNPALSTIVGYTTAHTYSASGDYTANLVCTNSVSTCGPSSRTVIVTVRNAQAQIVSNNTVCAGQGIVFSPFQSSDVLIGGSRGYLWFVDDLPPQETTNTGLSTILQGVGMHTIVLVVKDANSCMDTAKTTVRVSSVTPIFSTNVPSVCVNNGSFSIINTTAGTPDPIVSFNWNFGDGTSTTTTNNATFSHTYLTSSSPFTQYSISLVATNSLGCVGSTGLTVKVVKPFVSFVPQPNNFCVSAGAPTTLTLTPLGAYASYSVNFGDGSATTVVNGIATTHNYTSTGTFQIPIDVVDASGCTNSATATVFGVQTPTADFLFSSPNSTGGNNICSGQIVTFTNSTNPAGATPIWNLGSGILATSNSVVSLFYASQTNSAVAVTLTVNTGAPAFCTASVQKTFTVFAYDADFLLSDSIVCNGAALNFSFAPSTYGLAAWLWSFGDATSTTTLQASSTSTSAISHVYTNYTATAAGYTSVSLIYWSGEMACREAKEKLIKIEKVYPGFSINGGTQLTDTMHCLRLTDTFTDTSKVNSDTLYLDWFFGDGLSAKGKSPTHTYQIPGSYTTMLVATNERGCRDTTYRQIRIHDLPSAVIIPNPDGYCPDKLFKFTVSGSQGVRTLTLSPAQAFYPSAVQSFTNNLAIVQASLAVSGDFKVIVTDSNDCTSDPVDTNFVIVQPPVPVKWDTAVVVGELVPITVHLNPDIFYRWDPVIKDLSCSDCLTPVSNSTVDVLYTLVLEDKLRCSQVQSTYSIHILPLTSVDLPTAFTPNGDGVNDVIYVDGWGIKKLNYLRIYNRWGQLLFETNDISQGWDGNFNGVPQNMDSYVYQVSVETYIDEQPLTKSSTFKLIR